jgi:phosphate transport system substrate-binding protein
VIERRAFLAALALAGCSRRCGSGGRNLISLNGAGATFPFPLYSKWIAEFRRVAPDVRVNYQSIGSGGGVRQIVAETVDFGASDVPLSDEEEQGVPRPLVHIPVALGAVVVTYHLEGISVPIRITGETLAGVYLGAITRWNAPELVATNPTLTMPDERITVVYRSDGSGTTAIFTELLASASPEFRDRVSAGKIVRFPTGLGAKGNEGVTGLVKATPGAVSYTELAYAKQSQLPRAALSNRSGQFVEPTLDSIAAAAESVPMPDSLHASLADAPAADAYPLSAYTYLLLYRDLPDEAKGNALARFVWWATHAGQEFTSPLDYAPLPPRVVAIVERAIRALTADGRPVQLTH